MLGAVRGSERAANPQDLRGLEVPQEDAFLQGEGHSCSSEPSWRKPWDLSLEAAKLSALGGEVALTDGGGRRTAITVAVRESKLQRKHPFPSKKLKAISSVKPNRKENGFK